MKKFLLLLPFVLCLVIGTVEEVRSRTDTMTPLEYATAFCAENAVFQAVDGSLWQYEWEGTDDSGRSGVVALTKIGPLTVPEFDNVNDNLKLTITGLSRTDEGTGPENTWNLCYTLQKNSPNFAAADVLLQTYLDGGWYEASFFPNIASAGTFLSERDINDIDDSLLLLAKWGHDDETQPLPSGHYRMFAQRVFRGRYDIAELEFDLVCEDGCYRLFIDGEELS